MFYGVLIRFAVTGEMVKDSLEGRSLQEAMNEGKIYLIDYTYLENLQYTNETNEVMIPLPTSHRADFMSLK